MGLLPEWIRAGNRLHTARRALAYGIAGAGLLTTLTAMAALHPHEYVYFNALTDTKTPGALAKRYDMDYWQMADRQSLEYLLALYPDATLRVWMRNINRQTLPKDDRERIPVLDNPHAADFYLWTARADKLPFANPEEDFYYPRIEIENILEQPPTHSVRAYGSAIALIYGKDAAAYHTAYQYYAANGELLARADFDIYAYDSALHYLNSDCPPPAPNRADRRIFLHITPADLADLPADSRERGFENRDFQFNEHTAFFDGKCIIRQPLPDYAIARIATGQKTASGGDAWRADIDMAARAAAQAVYYSIAVGDYGKLVAQSDFDVYLRGNTLAYLKEPCAESDADARFILHITPSNPADLPSDRRERGFVNMDFRFAEHGARIDDKCVAERELPDYAIARIRTGHNPTAPGGVGWRADIDLAAHSAAQAVHARILAGDYGAPVAQSIFDLYLRDNALTYLKAPCAESDTDARFFLHITPVDPAALSAAARDRGFANLDFRFADHGIHASDMCVAKIDLPDYPIDHISAGQFVSGAGSLWRVEFPVAR